jgi:hypothetical protein
MEPANFPVLPRSWLPHFAIWAIAFIPGSSICNICRVPTQTKEWLGNPVDWTTALTVQIVAGFAGAHFAATALHEHRFGWIGHSLVGLIAGALSGWLLQTIVLTVVTGSGSTNELRPVEAIVIEAMTGAVVGAIAMASVGLAVNGTGART